MRITLFILISATLLACSHSELHKKLSGSDSLVINFNLEGTDSVIKTVATTENNAINKLIGFVDSKAEKPLKCGYDGNLIFYSAGKAIMPVVFKYKGPDCRLFLYELNGLKKRTMMSQEAADFLESLEEGRNYY